MDRKILKTVALAELVIAFITYFTVAALFDQDSIIMHILPHTNFEATLLRLSIYIIPGINIICGLFGIVFSTNGLLLFTGILQILAGDLTLHYKGRSELMNTLGIIMIVLGTLTVVTILIRKITEKRRSPE